MQTSLCSIGTRANQIVLALLVTAIATACQSSSADNNRSENGSPDFPPKGFTRTVEYPVDGVRLGQGWHDDQGEKAQAVCIEFQEEADDGQEQTMKMEVVTDHSEMMQSMEISAEMQVKAIAYEVSGKASYAKNVEMKSESMNFVVHAKVNNGVNFTAPLRGATSKSISLTPNYRNLAARNYPDFERQCGEAFVSAIFSGAELNAVLSFDEQSSSERETIEASMKGSGWGFEAEGSASSTMNDYASSSSLSISYYQTGGKGNPIPTDQEGFIDAISNLPRLANDAGYNYRIMIRSYKSLPNYPGRSEEPSSIFREQLSLSYGRLLTIHDEITSILEDLKEDENSWVFIPLDEENDEMLRTLQDELKNKLRAHRELARRCAFVEDDETPEEAPCELTNDLDTMNDYDYRIQLPLYETATEASEQNAAQLISDIIEIRVRKVSTYRCEDDLDDPGCLTNRQIDNLEEQLTARAGAI